MYWVIEGVTTNGRRFRPGDWVDRLSGALASFGPDQRLRYGAVKPCFINGQKCLLVQKTLEVENPIAFDYVSSFARSNDLRMSDIQTMDDQFQADSVANVLGAAA